MKEFIPFLDLRLHISWDEKFGFGVYAKEDIPNGIYVEMAPVIVFERPSNKKEIASSDFFRAIETNDPINPNLMPFLKYALAWHEETLALPLGWVGLYNHSDENNCSFSTNIVDELVGIITVKEVLKHQQLTVNYGPEWFSSREIEKLKL